MRSFVPDFQRSDPILANKALAMRDQHIHATGLAGRVLGAYQSALGQQARPGDITWRGFEYFARCRDDMRTATYFSVQNLQCHTLMIVYLVKGNAYQVYNLLGITVRKAYIAQRHQAPPISLTETDKTAHTQLWWMLYRLVVKCADPPRSGRLRSGRLLIGFIQLLAN